MTWTPSARDQLHVGVVIGGEAADLVLGEEGVDRALRRHVLADRDDPELAVVGLRLLAAAASVGNSLTHGAHQLAHRLTSTGVPLNSARSECRRRRDP